MQDMNKLPVVWLFKFFFYQDALMWGDCSECFKNMFCKITQSQMFILVVLTPKQQELRSSQTSGFTSPPVRLLVLLLGVGFIL